MQCKIINKTNYSVLHLFLLAPAPPAALLLWLLLTLTTLCLQWSIILSTLAYRLVYMRLIVPDEQ